MFVLASLLVMNIASFTNATAQTATPKTGIIVPLYIYPGPDWNELVKVKKENTAVPIVAIVNPDNGVGKSKDPNFVTGIKNLKSAGIIVVGYVWTDYAARSTSSVKAEIDKYKSWYAVNGIFFDAMSTAKGKEWYYKNLNSYAKSKALKPTIGNSGTDTRTSYIGTVDNIIIYEGAGTPSIDHLGGWHTSYSKKNFTYLAYGVLLLDEGYVKESVKYVGYLYITHDILTNPYDSLPLYLSELVSAVQEANSSS